MSFSYALRYLAVLTVSFISGINEYQNQVYREHWKEHNLNLRALAVQLSTLVHLTTYEYIREQAFSNCVNTEN